MFSYLFMAVRKALSLTHFRYGMEKPLFYRASLRIVNLAAFFLIFLASSASCGRCRSWRNNTIDVIQLLPLWIVNVGTSSMLGCF